MNSNKNTDVRPEAASDRTNLTGTIESINFSSSDGSFHIATVRQNDNCIVKVKGHLRGLRAGDPISAQGEWETHPKFGRQFRCRSVAWTPPTTAEGLVEVLSGLVDGVGEGLSMRLVRALGGPEATLRWLDGEDRVVPAVSGWPTARVDALRAAWTARTADRALETALASLAIAPAVRAKIAAKYGSRALEIIRTRPHLLALEVDGIGFLTADAIGKAVGVGAHSVERATAALRHALIEESEQRGHVWTDPSRANARIDTLCATVFPDDVFADAIDALEKRKILERSESGNLSTRALAKAERTIATAVWMRFPDQTQDTAGSADLDPALSNAQNAAVCTLLSRRFGILTGGPGVGKTTTTKALVDALDQQGKHFALVAPTGRAAKRLSEATGREATTIHRLLAYNPVIEGFSHNATNPLELDVLIADEFSMTDVSLCASLFNALRPGCSIVLIGDADQLPPVGPGAPFRDLVAELPENVVRLTEVFRQAQGSRIVMGSREILEGRPPQSSAPGTRDPGMLFFIDEPDPDALAARVVDVVAEHMPTHFGVASADVQVISPQKKGPIGVEALNAALRTRLNPRPAADVITVGSGERARTFRVGDRVMQTENNYEKGVVNGDLGIVKSLLFTNKRHPDEPNGVIVTFDGNDVPYESKEMGPLQLAYASTCHKCQGGEFQGVVLVIHDAHAFMLERALLYTGLTRAKHICIIVGTRKALARACRTARADNRRTTLPAVLNKLRDNAAASIVVNAKEFEKPFTC